MTKKGFLDTTYGATDKRWMGFKLFKNYVPETFIPLVEGNGQSLVIYDGHSTHIDKVTTTSSHLL